METAPTSLEIARVWTSIAFVILCWNVMRYAWLGKPLGFLDKMNSVMIGILASHGLFWIIRRWPLEKTSFENIDFPIVWCLISLLLLFFLTTYGIYYRIAKGRPFYG